MQRQIIAGYYLPEFIHIDRNQKVGIQNEKDCFLFGIQYQKNCFLLHFSKVNDNEKTYPDKLEGKKELMMNEQKILAT